jgi:hypothetical protein
MICLAIMMALSVEVAFTQNKETDKGFFVTAGFLYNSEKIEPDPQFATSGMNMAVGLGYDFEPVTINLLFDFMLLERIEYQGYGYSRDMQIKGGNNIGLGVNLGIKLLNGRVFDILLPVGGLFRFSGFEVRHDSERKFEYAYINVESGLVLSWRLSKMFAVSVPLNIGYPVYKNSTVENYAQKDYEVFHYSLGIEVHILINGIADSANRTTEVLHNDR